jgi:hypothetical protein
MHDNPLYSTLELDWSVEACMMAKREPAGSTHDQKSGAAGRHQTSTVPNIVKEMVPFIVEADD